MGPQYEVTVAKFQNIEWGVILNWVYCLGGHCFEYRALIEPGAASVELGATSIELGVTSIDLGVTSIDLGATSIELGAASEVAASEVSAVLSP